MPTPKKNQNKEDYISDCMSHSDTQKYDQKQRYAVCLNMWNEHKSQSALNEAIKEALNERVAKNGK